MTRKTTFFDGWSWFKLNNLGPALGMALIFYISVSKGFKLKVKTFWWLISTFVEVAGEKLGGEPFWPPPSWLGLRNVKKHPWRSATFSKSLLLFLLKVALLHGWFFLCFLNCTDGTKLHKASHIIATVTFLWCYC